MLGFAVRGLYRGTIRQVFAFFGVFGGIWTIFWVSRWVGAHWLDARPAVVFFVLRWAVAALAALAVASLFAWWGEVLAAAVDQSPVSWLDRAGGFVVGASLGATVAAFLLLVAVLAPWPREPRAWAAAARVSTPVLTGAARACGIGGPYVPGSGWLMTRFQAAARRVRAAVRPS